MKTTDWFKKDTVFFLIILVIVFLVYFGTDLSVYDFRFNDGSSYLCSFFDWELFHFGRKDIIACTYDHQPFYFLFLKLVRNLTNNNLELMRWAHQIVWFLIGLFIYNISKKLGHGKILSALVSIATLSSPILLEQTLQFRMYTFYLLFFLILFDRRFFSRWQGKVTRLWAMISYMTFIFILLPLAFWHLSDVVKSGKKQFIKILKENYILITLVLLKVTYVIYHRVGRRPWPGDFWYSSFDSWRNFQEWFYCFLGWRYLNVESFFVWLGIFHTTILLLIITKLYSTKNKSVRSIINLCLFSYAIIFILRFVFVVQEIEYRYIIYTTPLILITSLEILKDKTWLYHILMGAFLISLNLTNYFISPRFIYPLQTTKNEISKMNQFIQQENPPYFYTFHEYRDVNYHMSYLHMFWRKSVPFFEVKDSFYPLLLTGNQYFLVEQGFDDSEEKRLNKILEMTEAKATKVFCIDLQYPKVCVHKVTGNKRFDHLTTDEIQKNLIPPKTYTK